MRKALAAIVIATSIMSGGVSARAQNPTLYRPLDLGAMGGPRSHAAGINAAGDVVGVAAHAFLYSGGRMIDLGVLSGGQTSYARAVNDSGMVVGSGDVLGGGGSHAFLYSNGTMTDIGTLAGGSTVAYGINKAGDVVGSSYTSAALHAFVYSAGSMHDLGTLGGMTSIAHGINDSGVIVGASSRDGYQLSRAFIYSNNTMTDLGIFGGSPVAMAINNSGQIAGSGYGTNGNPFLYSGGVTTDLGAYNRTLSRTQSITSGRLWVTLAVVHFCTRVARCTI